MMRLAILIALAAPSAFAAGTITLTGSPVLQDGDTFEIGPVLIRLDGVDAPEAGQHCTDAEGREWACGTEATNRLAELIEGREITCIGLDRDAYGRIISTCQVNGAELGAMLVAEGTAWAFMDYSDRYAAEASAAQAQGLGVYAGDNQTPSEYRADAWERAAAASPRPGCPIKGNIALDGERIYHTPWSPYYSRTRITEAKGERWFCDEAEAVKAGWRAARWR